MGYLLFIVAVIILLRYIIKEAQWKNERLSKINDNELRRKYEDKNNINEASRLNNEIGKIYRTEFANQDYLDDKYKHKTKEDINDLNYMLPKDLNTVGKLQGNIYNENDQISSDTNSDYKWSVKTKDNGPVEKLLKEIYDEEKRVDTSLGSQIDHEI